MADRWQRWQITAVFTAKISTCRYLNIVRSVQTFKHDRKYTKKERNLQTFAGKSERRRHCCRHLSGILFMMLLAMTSFHLRTLSSNHSLYGEDIFIRERFRLFTETVFYWFLFLHQSHVAAIPIFHLLSFPIQCFFV